MAAKVSKKDLHEALRRRFDHYSAKVVQGELLEAAGLSEASSFEAADLKALAKAAAAAPGWGDESVAALVGELAAEAPEKKADDAPAEEPKATKKAAPKAAAKKK